MGKVLMLNENCDPSLGNDPSLPNNAFLVEYIDGDISKYDLVMSNKKVDIFDEYYDRYKNNLVNIIQAEGKINPKLYKLDSKKKK